jgi:hypothetical protein
MRGVVMVGLSNTTLESGTAALSGAKLLMGRREKLLWIDTIMMQFHDTKNTFFR